MSSYAGGAPVALSPVVSVAPTVAGAQVARPDAERAGGVTSEESAAELLAAVS